MKKMLFSLNWHGNCLNRGEMSYLPTKKGVSVKKGKLLATCFLASLLVFMAQGAQALVISETEPNDSFATAQNIDPYFSLGYNSDIGDYTTNTSTSIPWVSILGTGNGTYDYFSFTVPSGGGLDIFDIDYGMNQGGSFDPYLRLYNAGQSFIASNDDNGTNYGQGGSIHSYDSYLQRTLSAGLYYLKVSRYSDYAIPNGATYTLQVSIGNHTYNNPNVVPEPATLLLLGGGLLGLGGRGLRKKNRG
jgi:hypothetical protein